MSVSDIIEEGLWVHHPKLSAEEREQRVVAALNDVGLDPETRFRYPHEFSGGQRQRIAVARAIVLEPTFVVLDEPTSALDMLIQAQIVDLLRDLQKRRDLTYLFISHDLRVVAALASRLIVMRNGKVVEEGPAAELFANPQERLHARAVRRRVQSRSRARRRADRAGNIEDEDVKALREQIDRVGTYLANEGRVGSPDYRRNGKLGAAALARAVPARVSGSPGGADSGRRDRSRDRALRGGVEAQPGALAGFPKLAAIFNLGAGVDAVVADLTLPPVPLVRVAVDDLTKRMTEYVVMHVLMHHRRQGYYTQSQRDKSGRRSCNGPRATCASASWGWACSGATRPTHWRVSASTSRAGAARGRRCPASSAIPATASSTTSSRAPTCWSACCR